MENIKLASNKYKFQFNLHGQRKIYHDKYFELNQLA